MDAPAILRGMNRRIFIARSLVASLVLPFWLAGCSTFDPSAKVLPPGPRAFDFATDTLAVPLSEPGLEEKESLAGTALRGHADAHVARQFFLHARFEPAQPPPSVEARIGLVREVLRRSPTEASPEGRRVVVPGYANLREFSRLQGHLLRAESWLACPCESRVPLLTKAFVGDSGKDAAVAELLASTGINRPALVRLYRQHTLHYGRSLLVFGAQAAEGEVRFTAYDPAAPQQPVQLTFNRASRVFALSDDAVNSGTALGVDVYRR